MHFYFSFLPVIEKCRMCMNSRWPVASKSTLMISLIFSAYGVKRVILLVVDTLICLCNYYNLFITLCIDKYIDRIRWEDNIKINLTDLVWGEWIALIYLMTRIGDFLKYYLYRAFWYQFISLSKKSIYKAIATWIWK